MIELFTGFPLFPGTNEREQLQLIIDVIGMPSQQVLKISQRKQLFNQFKDGAVPAPNEVLTNDQKEERLKYIMNKLREMPDPQFVNFISRCLEWDPKKRLTPDDGLQHEWIIKGLPPNIILHNPNNNPYQRNTQNSSNSTHQSKQKRKNSGTTGPQSTRPSANNEQSHQIPSNQQSKVGSSSHRNESDSKHGSRQSRQITTGSQSQYRQANQLDSRSIEKKSSRGN